MGCKVEGRDRSLDKRVDEWNSRFITRKNWGEPGMRGRTKELLLENLRFVKPIRHQSGNVKRVVLYMILEQR